MKIFSSAWLTCGVTKDLPRTTPCCLQEFGVRRIFSAGILKHRYQRLLGNVRVGVHGKEDQFHPAATSSIHALRPAHSTGIPMSTITRSGLKSVAIFIKARPSLTHLPQIPAAEVSEAQRKTLCGRQPAKCSFVSCYSFTPPAPHLSGQSVFSATSGTVAMILVPCHGFDSTDSFRAQVYPFLHTQQAQSFPSFRLFHFEACPGVLHYKLNRALHARELQL